MKILLATPSLLKEIGGPAYSVNSIQSHLKKSAIDTVAFTQKSKGGASLPLIGNQGIFDGVDVVHNFGTWTHFGHRISVKSRQANIPYVFCPMGMLEPWALTQKRLKKLIGFALYQRDDLEGASAIHATATSEAENLRALGIRAPIAVIPHGIDLPDSLIAKTSANMDSNEKIILFLSRIHPKKGLIELVQACARLKSKNWKVIIAGTDMDGYQAVIEDAVKSAHLQDQFKFAGPVYGDQKSALFKQADIFVLPTHSENFGLVIAEALAHHVPVITTHGAPWAELKEFDCGWWTSTGVDALETALSEAIEMSSLTLQEMGNRGRQLIEERYTWPEIIKKHIELYHWIIGDGQKPDFFF